MECLYLSYLIPEEEFQKIRLLDESPQIPTHKFNWKIFKGISGSALFKAKMHIISTRPITDFPRSKIKYVKSVSWDTEYGMIHENWFLNYPVVKQVTIFISTFYKSLCWVIKTPRSRRKCVLVYSVSLPYLICGYIVSKICGIPLIGIWTDPPVVPTPWDSRLKTKLRTFQDSFSKFFMKGFNGVVSLTRFLAMDYNPSAKHLLIEAIADDSTKQINSKVSNSKFIIFYAGSLLKKYGILEAIKAFNELDYPDLELWLFGKGDIEEEIREMAARNVKIKYYGFVDNHKVMELQRHASLLINPRPVNLSNGRYSFPSKILEYLQSGTPAVVTRLSGIPHDYYDYLFFFDSDDSLSMKKKIKEIYLMDREKLREFGNRALAFSKTKSIEIQGNKIATFIDAVCE